MEKKKELTVAILGLILVGIVLALLVFIFKGDEDVETPTNQEQDRQEILDSLTAPESSDEGAPVESALEEEEREQIIDSLSAPE